MEARRSSGMVAADGSVGRLPPTIRLRGVDLSLAMRRHAASRSETSHVVPVDLAPDAPRSSGAETLQERAFVEPLSDPVDPPPAQRHLQAVGYQICPVGSSLFRQFLGAASSPGVIPGA
jgi:hypothetical protein